MNRSAEFAIIGMQRTGTTVLTTMLNSNKYIFVAREIFHPYAEGIESFFEFCRRRERSSFLLSERSQLYDEYIQMLRTETAKPIIGVNIKYGSCHHLNGDWKRLGDPPDIFDVFRRRGTKIIHIVRENTFNLAISLI